MFRQTLLHVLAAAPLLGLAWAVTAEAEAPPKITGAHTHENLSIFLIHGKSADGPVPLTLEEGLAKGFVEVHETDTVSQLIIENKGNDEVFVHAGDIVKGGKQDRVVTASFVLAAKSKPMEVPVYCVEAGRWAPRGQEDSRKFSAAAEMLPTKEAKLAMMASPQATGAPRRGQAEFDPTFEPQQRAEPPRNTRIIEREPGQREVGGQSEVWRNVAEIQKKLSLRLKKTVNSDVSQSSLQLALEHKDLAAQQERFVKALQGAGEVEDDIVGYAIAVNGKIASADVYASNALFRKLWPRLLKAAATEAISAEEVKDAKVPSPADVAAFLLQPADVKTEEVKPVAGISVTARAAETSYDAETYRGGQLLHRSKLAR
jgi:hypothetical protein